MTTRPTRPTRPTTRPATRQSIERALREWLRTHHGVIGRYEAVRLGASSDLIRYKLESGEWVAIHRGVYRDTSVPRTPYQDLRAACVAIRGAGVVSHTSAGWLWGLLPELPPRPELSVATAGGRRQPGITIHRSKDLDVSRAVLRHEILVTNPLRTIVDLAGVVSPPRLTDAIDVALAKRLITVAGLTAELDRLASRGRPGVGTLRRQLVGRGFIGAPAPSVLESKMQRVIIATGLPLPTPELHVGGNGEYYLDFAWPSIMLCVEVDGYVWHFSPEHQQRDVRRRTSLQDAGWTLRIYTWRDVCDEPARVASEIATAYHRLIDRQP